MTGATHRTVEVRGGHIHLVEQGEGPLVLLVHGFPELWFSWRHQLPALAAAGFHAVAIDVRGYGGSSAPSEVEAYRMLAHVADNVGVVHALGASTATIVGHDWGSAIASSSALLRPDVFTAVGLLGVPYNPPGGPRPTSVFPPEFYVSYFQEPGRAEAEIDPDVRGWLAGFYAAVSGDAPEGAHAAFMIPPGGTMRDRMPAGGAPDWLSASELDTYAQEFARTGLTGGLNRYRNFDRDWEDLAAWEGEPLRARSLFVAGERDPTTTWMAGAIDAHASTLPGLVSSHILTGCGHWVQQERPDEVNALLLDWLG